MLFATLQTLRTTCMPIGDIPMQFAVAIRSIREPAIIAVAAMLLGLFSLVPWHLLELVAWANCVWAGYRIFATSQKLYLSALAGPFLFAIQGLCSGLFLVFIYEKQDPGLVQFLYALGVAKATAIFVFFYAILSWIGGIACRHGNRNKVS